MKTVLAAVDKVGPSTAVVGKALGLARLLGYRLTILSVINSDPMATKSLSEEQTQLSKLHNQLISKYFAKNELVGQPDPTGGTIYRSNQKPDLTISSKVLQGNPVDRICHYADEIDADLVIVGTRGLSSIGLGSVSESVVKKCSRSVLVVKPGHTAEADWFQLAAGSSPASLKN